MNGLYGVLGVGVGEVGVGRPGDDGCWTLLPEREAAVQSSDQRFGSGGGFTAGLLLTEGGRGDEVGDESGDESGDEVGDAERRHTTLGDVGWI